MTPREIYKFMVIYINYNQFLDILLILTFIILILRKKLLERQNNNG